MGTDSEKTAFARMGTTLLRYVLGPVLVALVVGTYSRDNHQQSSAGYEVLAKSINQEVLTKIEILEKRIVKLEAKVVLQPTSAPATQLAVVKPPKPHPVVKVPATKVPEKAPAKAPAKVPESKAPPIKLPASMPAPAKAPHLMKRVPERLNQVKL